LYESDGVSHRKYIHPQTIKAVCHIQISSFDFDNIQQILVIGGRSGERVGSDRSFGQCLASSNIGIGKHGRERQSLLTSSRYCGSLLESDNTMNIMEQLKARASDHQTAAAAIREKANSESRDLTNAEREIIQSHLDAFDAVQTDIELQARLEGADDFLNQSAGRKTKPDGLKNTVIPTAQERGQWGFQNFGEYIKAVKDASISGGKVDPRFIANAATTYGSEGVGADGGFAVPPEWRSTIMELVSPEDSLLSRTDQMPISGNSVTFPIDETTAHQTTGGILAYWDSEAATINQSKPALKDLTVKTEVQQIALESALKRINELKAEIYELRKRLEA